MKFLTILIIPLIVACGSSKKAVKNKELPTWAVNRPSEPAYYYGIGSALKQGDDYVYQNRAKKAALSDLLSEISARVSSYSVLSQIENNDQFTQDFTQSIRLQSQNRISGYELVNTYDDGSRYWILYRLDKSVYEQQQREEREKAMALAIQRLNEAETFRNQKDLHSAFVWKIKALEAIKNYLDDPLEVSLKGEQTYLGNHIYLQLLQSISSISISAPEKIPATRSLPLSFKLIVRDEEGLPLQNIPLYISYSGLSIEKRAYVSNSQGEINYYLSSLKSSANEEKVTARLNLEKLADEATNDNLIKRIISKNLSVKPVTTRLVINKPALKLEKVNSMVSSYVIKSLNKELFEVVDKGLPDYTLSVKEWDVAKSSKDDLSIYEINSNWELRDSTNKVIIDLEINGDRALHYDETKAREKAMTNWEREFEKLLIPKLKQLLSGL